jgi:hypothetical protein
MKNFNGSWVEIFSTGTHTDSEGRGHSITAQFLEDVVRNYDTTLHESPAVIGHPADNAPAYGWPEQLRVRDGRLEVRFKEIDPNFEEMVRKGYFKKRSASFYTDPKSAPGGRAPYLRHIGFLGAQPPAVKGLKDIQFSEGESLTFEASINFSEDETMDKEQVDKVAEGVFERIKSALGLGKKDDPPGSASFTEADVQRIVADAVKASSEALNANFGEQLKQRDTKITELETKVSSQGVQGTRQQIIAFTEKLGAAKFPPAFRNLGAVEFMEALALSDQKVTVISFAEKDGQKVETKTETPLLQWFQNFLEAQGPYIEFGERLGAVKATGADDVTAVTDERKAELREKAGLPAKQGGE